MPTRRPLPIPILPAVCLGVTLAGASAAMAQGVDRMDTEPPGLQPLAAHVSGRAVMGPGGSLRRQWPGTYAEAAFIGREVYFRVGPGEVSLRVRLDTQAPVALVKPSPGLYRVTASAEAAAHRLRIDVASESQAGATSFGGFFLAAEGRRAPLPARARQIEFIGDSHTVGYGNTAPSRACSEDQVWAFTDTTLGVAPRVAARYDADYQVNAISGRGVVRNFDGLAADVLPALYPFALFDKETAAVDPAWRPRAVMVNLGTNDFATPLRDGERWTARERLQADYVAGYVDFIQALRKRHPQAYLLLWAAAGEDSELVIQVRKVLRLVRQSGDARIGLVTVPGLSMAGCNFHPSVADDERIAQALARHLDARVPELGAP